MVGGATVLRQPISREAALVAHTRRNAYFVFQETNLGSHRGRASWPICWCSTATT